MSLALSATLEALPKNPPSRLLAPPRMLPAVPSVERMNSLRYPDPQMAQRNSNWYPFSSERSL